MYYEKLGLKKYSDEFPDKSGTNLARQFWSDADNSNSKKKFLNTLIKDYEKRNHNNFNKNSFFADRNTQSKIADYNVFDGDLEDKNEIIENIKFQKEDYQKSKIECRSFVLKTTYPGFLTGTGQPHGAGKKDKGVKCGSDEDVNMGFSFDYVTGQPIIAGSSVKGVLRSHFENHAEAVAEILKKDILNNQSITEKNVKNLMTAIFNNSDVFLDAVIRHGDDDGKIMGFDYITPHESTTKNPVPIKIIKVLPDVVFEFRFIITNKTIDGISISAENILKLFEELLCLFGSGAKTNVGYGMFDREMQEVENNRNRLVQQNRNENDGNRSIRGINNSQNDRNPDGGGNSQNSRNRSNSGNNQDNRTAVVFCRNCGMRNAAYDFRGNRNTTCQRCHKSLLEE